ncbi:MAG TPA: hypothetical protein VFW28_10570 [Micropepsaceae bacterium]|nr:hypothetical protein [Micropepsaceae bacterium]
MARGDNAHWCAAAGFLSEARDRRAAHGAAFREIDACLFKGGPHRVGVVGDWGALAPLEIGYRGGRYSGFFGQILLGPSQKGSSGPNLRSSKFFWLLAD